MAETNHQQYATDFISLLNCPPLISNALYAADSEWLQKFRSRAIIPSPSEYQGSRRLGFYYQWLWKQLIKAHPDYQLIAEEIQLQWNKQTLGAIDFLVKNLRNEQLEHWEVSIKFYLAYQQSWLGPNAQDNLDKKVHRMTDHQLKLCEHPAYKSQLAVKYGQPVVKRLIMQGRLFYPFKEEAFGSGIELNPNAFTGLWCYSPEASTLSLRIIGKENWICPPGYHELTKSLETKQVNVPAQAVDPNNRLWFVMPEYWPNQNKIQ
ncbi:DUF1853 family protein [uncultured Photobacterium sp.]|uniref:DUF1853 family protein n=1 Tax=uncultured Photobacterium sp. TaxID=173973 RepID=UPI0026351948|nr:DUF1853 family protein [uncultured Photobacterium sp.]